QRAIAVLEEALNQCHTAHVPLFVAGMTISLGLAYALAGRGAEAVPLLDQVQVQEETLTSLGGNSTVLRVGEAYLRVGRWHDAFQLAELAQRLSHGRKERGNLAWVLWLLGEIAMCRQPAEVEPAEAHYRQALSLAEELGMRPLVAHCHLGLGKLYAEVGRHEEAQVALAGAVELYRALDMMYWLPQVEARLA
ncbi:MAG TPA: tetratricopeptide repeat protein, partial [Candidatus Tectomicrobia bacterium]|nr:tetratricopeptide repeat protein [Candidatus Tectomicrobia bacterium]